MNSASTAIIDRVKKLLALSKSSNAHESALALAKANAIIVEHQIDLVLLDSSDSAMPEPFDEQIIRCTQRKRIELKAIAWLLEGHFRCKVVYTYHHADGVFFPTMTVIGRRSDAEFGLWLVSYLHEEFMRRWADFKQEVNAASSEKNAFIYGMYKGLDARLCEERAQMVQSRIAKIAARNLAGAETRASIAPAGDVAAAFPDAEESGELLARYQIAVQTEQESLEQEMNRRHSDLRSGRGPRVNVRPNDRAMAAGKASGRKIHCNRPIGPGD